MSPAKSSGFSRFDPMPDFSLGFRMMVGDDLRSSKTRVEVYPFDRSGITAQPLLPVFKIDFRTMILHQTFSQYRFTRCPKTGIHFARPIRRIQGGIQHTGSNRPQ